MPRDKVAKIYSKTSLKDGAAVQQILDRSFICDNIREICGQTKTTVAWFGYSVTRLDDFLKFLVTKFPTKVTQIISNFLGYFEKPHSYVKTALATSWVTWKNLGYFLIMHMVTLFAYLTLMTQLNSLALIWFFV